MNAKLKVNLVYTIREDSKRLSAVRAYKGTRDKGDMVNRSSVPQYFIGCHVLLINFSVVLFTQSF